MDIIPTGEGTCSKLEKPPSFLATMKITFFFCLCDKFLTPPALPIFQAYPEQALFWMVFQDSHYFPWHQPWENIPSCPAGHEPEGLMMLVLGKEQPSPVRGKLLLNPGDPGDSGIQGSRNPGSPGLWEVAVCLDAPGEWIPVVGHLTELLFGCWNSTRTGEIGFLEAFWKFCIDLAWRRQVCLELLNCKVHSSIRGRKALFCLQVIQNSSLVLTKPRFHVIF